TSAMCVSDPEAALCPLHGGNGGACLRGTPGPVPENRGHVLLCLGPGENRRDLLRVRLDAALERSADHPHGSDPAALAGKYWTTGRGHPRVTWPRFHSGIHRYPDSLRHFARLPADAEVGGGFA